MAEDEREKTARMVLARNEKRLKALKAAPAREAEADSGTLPLEDAPSSAPS